MFFIGQTRFSLVNPGSAAWVLSRDSNDSDYLEKLYAPERLDSRMHIFLNWSLPQLAKAAEGHTVRHLVSYSDTLPERYKRQLRDAAQKFPFLVLDEWDDSPSVTVQEAAASIAGGKQQEFGFYRLDDDDILPADYFARMSSYLKPDFRGFAVTLARGFTALYEGGKLTNIRETHHPMISIGILTVSWVDEDGEVKLKSTGAHITADRRMPVVMDSRTPGYVWMRHISQDSASGVPEEKRREVLIKNMNRDPELTEPDEFVSAFPTLENVIPFNTEVQRSGVAFPHSEEFSNPVKKLRFNYELASKKDLADKPALVSVDVRDETTGLKISGIVIPGLAESQDPAVGYFSYLQPGQEKTLQIDLPKGCVAHGFTLRRWRDDAVWLAHFNTDSSH